MKALEAARYLVDQLQLHDRITPEEFLAEREAALDSMFPTAQLMPGSAFCNSSNIVIVPRQVISYAITFAGPKSGSVVACYSFHWQSTNPGWWTARFPESSMIAVHQSLVAEIFSRGKNDHRMSISCLNLSSSYCPNPGPSFIHPACLSTWVLQNSWFLQQVLSDSCGICSNTKCRFAWQPPATGGTMTSKPPTTSRSSSCSTTGSQVCSTSDALCSAAFPGV